MGQTVQQVENPDASTLAAFGCAVLIGGTNFVAVKFSNEALPPSFGAAIRFTAAAVLFFLLTRVLRLELPTGRARVGAALYGLLGFGVSYWLLYYAVGGLGAGTTSVMVAAAPLATLLLAVLQGQERFSARGLIGGLLAIAGIALLSWRSVGGDVSAIHVGAALVAVIAIAESTVVVKGFPKAHPLATNAVATTVGSAFLLVASLLAGENWSLPETARTWLVLAWLVVAGTVGLFWLFLFVVGRWTASASVYAITLMPVVAVALGALVADETITWELAAGGALVIAAVYVGALSGHRRAPEVASLPDCGQAMVGTASQSRA